MFGISGRGWSYTSINSKSPDEKQLQHSQTLGEEHSHRSQQRRRLTIVTRSVIAALCAFSILLGVGMLAISIRKTTSPKNNSGRLCGNSTAEALSLGCTFDQLMWTWFPPNCPHYANDQFVQAEKWEYYLNPYTKEKAEGENWTKALDNQIDLWGQKGEHLTHCILMFLSIGQMLRDGTPYVPIIVKYEHIDHCAGVLLEQVRKDEEWHSVGTHVPDVRYDQNC
ncbi:hypothetical protein EV356DRAFT_562919 [Viridothelium virens]|uniref:Uncharacterized protein n=1 Tax=Viridothelium virens TaxID=1048519 RepID=A0A6A6HNP1_VIRVR|nr:hypothetical protein EV356DRAFT_562919 [Viridothelium virens]